MAKALFCWSDISGYMVACWRELQKIPDIDFFVIAFQAKTQTAFHDQLMAGIPCQLLNLEERYNNDLIANLIEQQQPDIIILCGWFHPPYRRLTYLKRFKNTQFILAMDTPWWGTWKQQLGRYLLRPYLNKMSRVAVTGERSWQYAIRLGIPQNKIMRGVYGIDYDYFFSLAQGREKQPWPQKFLFVGRYEENKGIDILISAYKQYRQKVENPWEIICCGKGPLEYLLTQQLGIVNQGFVQPDLMDKFWQNAGCFILPSRFDPWPLALVEAAASGLPILCTEACGSAVEVVRPQYNGLMIPSKDTESLCQAMVTIHKNYPQLPTWGQRSQQLAAPYSASQWALRWHHFLLAVGKEDLA